MNPLIIAGVLVVLGLWLSIRVVKQYERGVLFRRLCCVVPNWAG